MIPLFVSKNKNTGILIYASSSYSYLVKMTEMYLKIYNFNIEYDIEAVIGIEPVKEKND
jgi:hypothetical protein